MNTLLYFFGFIFMLVTYFYVTTTAVSIGVKTGIDTWYQEFMEHSAAAMASLDMHADEDVVIADIESGVISEEEGNKILRNMRGEK